MSNARMRLHLARLCGATAAVIVGFGLAASSGAGAAPTGTTGNTGIGSISGDTGNSGNDAPLKSLAGIKVRASADITDRLNALTSAIATVNAASGLGAGQATVVSYLTADIAPLQALDRTIQADTTLKQASRDFSNIFNVYRVYVLTLPAAAIAAQAARATNTAIPNLTKALSQAESFVNPSSQAELQPLIGDLNSQIGTATAATNGQVVAVLALTPTQWNVNHALLAGPKSSATTAAAALQKGRDDVAKILQDQHSLRLGGLQSNGTATTGGTHHSGLGSALRGTRTSGTTG